VLAGPLTCLSEHQVFRSLRAVVSQTPLVTVNDEGLAILGGRFDRWQLAWSEIEAMAPEPARLREALTSGAFVALQFRTTKEPPPRPWSAVQHSVHRRLLEVGAYVEPLSTEDTDRLISFFEANIDDRQPFLISDWE
jgi:hypothetical protein